MAFSVSDIRNVLLVVVEKSKVLSGVQEKDGPPSIRKPRWDMKLRTAVGQS